jgi:hypothetical protein
VSSWALDAVMPFIGHVPKLNFEGCVKASQVARIEGFHEQILKIIKPTPKLTDAMMKFARRSRAKATDHYNTVHGNLSDVLRPIADDWASTTSTSMIHNYEAYDVFFRGEREITRRFYLNCSMLQKNKKTDRYWIHRNGIQDAPSPMIVREKV